MGGTWDLFRYPGIRSDSDMYTLGYSFYPWRAPKSIADGPSILEYVKDTAREFGIDKKIEHGLHVQRASWCSETSRWTVEAEATDSGEVLRFDCGFTIDGELTEPSAGRMLSITAENNVRFVRA